MCKLFKQQLQSMKSIKIIVLGIITLLNQQTKSQVAENWNGNRPDGHAPISITADHYHSKGGIMLSYRFMSMHMEGLVNSSGAISNNDVHDAGYMVTPLKMPMEMHMFGLMYAPSNKVTLLGMINIIKNDMNLQMKMMESSAPFSTSSSGFGDLKLGMIYNFLNKNQNSLHGNLTFSIPTGSFSKTDKTPMSASNEIQLPYPMQIGSGTFDTNLGITYLGQRKTFSWGSQVKGTFRFGKNADDYALGDRYKLNNWLAIKATNWLSFSARIEGIIVDKIRGVNANLKPMMVTTADTSNSGGKYINRAFGFNVYASKGKLKDLRLGFEYSNPFYQKPKGIQLNLKETITVGLQYAL